MASCSRGRFMRRSEVGQDRRPGTCLASTHSGGSGRPSGPEKGSATEVGWTGTGGGAKSPCGQVPGSTDQGLKRPGRSAGRRCRGLYFPASRETTRGRCTTRCVCRRSVSPQKGEANQKPNSRGGAGTKRHGCFKFSS